MKWTIAAGLCFLIIVVFSIPIFHDAAVQGRVLKVARTIASDLMALRHASLKHNSNCGMSFDRAKNSYTTFCAGNAIKVVPLDKISKGVVLSDLFKVVGTTFENDTVTFGPDGKQVSNDANKNSVFLIDKRDEKEGVKENVIRIFIGIDGKIDILKVDKIFDNGDLAFEPL